VVLGGISLEEQQADYKDRPNCLHNLCTKVFESEYVLDE